MSLRRSLLLSSAIVALACTAWIASCTDTRPTTGSELFKAWACFQCHAEDGRGIQGLGPPIVGKSAHWTRETLTQYLRDPVGYAAKTPRLKEQGRAYMTPMPPVLTQDEAAVARLVDHVLSLARP